MLGMLFGVSGFCGMYFHARVIKCFSSKLAKLSVMAGDSWQVKE
jgi:hypothetical protein